MIESGSRSASPCTHCDLGKLWSFLVPLSLILKPGAIIYWCHPVSAVRLKYVIQCKAPRTQRNHSLCFGHHGYSHHNQCTLIEIKGDDSEKDEGKTQRLPTLPPPWGNHHSYFGGHTFTHLLLKRNMLRNIILCKLILYVEKNSNLSLNLYCWRTSPSLPSLLAILPLCCWGNTDKQPSTSFSMSL